MVHRRLKNVHRVIDNARGIADPERATLAQLNFIVTREATVLTFNDCFLVMAGLFALMMVLVPLIRRPGSPAPVGAAH